MSFAAPFVWSGGESKSGLTLTVTILDTAGATVSSGLSGIAEVGSTGMYRWYYAAFSDDFVGFVQFLDGSTVVAMFPISPADAADLLTATRAAKLDLIGSGQVSVVAPVAAGGDVVVIRGDDYLDVDSRALFWSADDWPDLTGADIALQIGTPGDFSKDGSVVTPTGTAQVQVELTRGETNPLKAGSHDLAVVATLSDDSVVTLVRATLTVLNRTD